MLNAGGSATSNGTARDGQSPRFLNLPDPLSDLIGRDKELDDLEVKLRESAVTVVEGPRGVGKTNLVLHLLQRLAASHEFGAIVWTTASITKGAFNADDLLHSVALTLDFPFEPQTTPEIKLEMVLRELAGKPYRCLITIDNYEAVTDPAVHQLICELLPSNCVVLLTSSVAMTDPRVRVCPLDELPTEQAMALLRKRAEEAGVESQVPDSLEQVYRRVGGNALVLEWVVGQLRARRALGIVLSTLDRGQSEILSTLFQSNWELLDARARLVLCAISRFPAPPPLELIRAACGLGDEQVDRAIQELSRLFLVKIVTFASSTGEKHIEDRFVLHPITREFAENQPLVDSDWFRANAVRYVSDYVAERGGAPESEERERFETLNREHTNVLAVLDLCARQNDDARLVSLAMALSRWMFIEGHWTDLEKWSKSASEAATRLGDRSAQGRLWAELGRVHSYRGQYGKADDALQRAIAAASTEPTDHEALGYALHHQGESYIRRERYVEATAVLWQAKQSFALLHRRRLVIGVEYRIAVLAFERGHFDEAKVLFETGLLATIDDEWGRLEGLHRRYLAEIELAAETPRLAWAHSQIERARHLISETDTRTQAQLELLEARIAYANGDSANAIRIAKTSRTHFEKLRMRKEWDQSEELIGRLTSIQAPQEDSSTRASLAAQVAPQLLVSPRVFISYAWENKVYCDLVEALAARLREDGIDARLDRWHVGHRTIAEFMNSELRQAKKIMILCSPQYRQKVHAMEDGERATGSGWEAMLVNTQIFSNLHVREKLVIVLTMGNAEEAVPSSLIGFDRVVLPLNPFDQTAYELLCEKLVDATPQAPPLNPLRAFTPRPVKPLR